MGGAGGGCGRVGPGCPSGSLPSGRGPAVLGDYVRSSSGCPSWRWPAALRTRSMEQVIAQTALGQARLGRYPRTRVCLLVQCRGGCVRERRACTPPSARQPRPVEGTGRLPREGLFPHQVRRSCLAPWRPVGRQRAIRGGASPMRVSDLIRGAKARGAMQNSVPLGCAAQRGYANLPAFGACN